MSLSKSGILFSQKYDKNGRKTIFDALLPGQKKAALFPKSAANLE